MPSKWDAVFDLKPVPVTEYVLVECSKLFAKDLSTWPPPIDDVTGSAAALLASEPPPPSARLMREAFKLARWDLARELDAYDEYMRNERWGEAGLIAAEKPMLLFMSRFIEEQLLGLGEATKGRVDRKAMMRVLELTERAMARAAP
jgi:hypothetical protein